VLGDGSARGEVTGDKEGNKEETADGFVGAVLGAAAAAAAAAEEDDDVGVVGADTSLISELVRMV
jgi:hypothetical protein